MEKAPAVFGEETLILGQILTQTIQQVNEMEKLVTNTEKYTQKFREYNELAENQLDRARRIRELAENQVYLMKVRPENLAEINGLIRELQFSMESLNQVQQEYERYYAESKINESNSEKNSVQLKNNTGRLKHQALNHKSQLKGTTEEIRINTANTAIEASKTNELLNKLSYEQDKQNAIRAKEELRKINEEKEKRKFYGLGRDGR